MSWIFVWSLRRWPKKTRCFLSSLTLGLFSLSLSKNEMKDNLFEPFPPFIVSYCTFLWKVFSCFCTSFVFQTTVRISQTSSCFLNSLPISLQNVWLLDSHMIRFKLTKKEGQFQDKKRERENKRSLEKDETRIRFVSLPKNQGRNHVSCQSSVFWWMRSHFDFNSRSIAFMADYR